jgi:hypothetical protein
MRRHSQLRTRFALVPLIGLTVGLAVMLGGSGLSPSAALAARSTKTHSAQDATHDFLYISDRFTNTVQRVKADALHQTTSETFVAADGSGGPIPISGPRGLVFSPTGRLVLVNQNVSSPCLPGEVDEFDAHGFVATIIPATVGSVDCSGPITPFPHGPFGPRGLVIRGHSLWVSDQTVDDGTSPGRVSQWKFEENKKPDKANFLGDLDASAYTNGPGHPQYHPRGMVFGPDGKLYVSSFNVHFEDGHPNGVTGFGGAILRFDAEHGKFLDVFVDGGPDVAPGTPGTNQPCKCDLNKPEGIAFGPDGNIYVPSRANALTTDLPDVTDTDKILVFEGPHGKHPGKLLDSIDLDQPHQLQNWAQAAIFGPHGRLFVPIAGNNNANDGPFVGQVRSYDVHTKSFEEVVKPTSQGGPLTTGWYLTFGRTDPATLAYPN